MGVVFVEECCGVLLWRREGFVIIIEYCWFWKEYVGRNGGLVLCCYGGVVWEVIVIFFLRVIVLWSILIFWVFLKGVWGRKELNVYKNVFLFKECRWRV